ncbi:OmpA family protein [Actinomadura flavalba]|uniref:OmpA family protein n=1 Tax=Actinomadura flavalba TaxID=1120938 RepID=UPI000376AEA0|nr:OmpA family protein [Actinomadura flavalba]
MNGPRRAVALAVAVALTVASAPGASASPSPDRYPTPSDRDLAASIEAMDVPGSVEAMDLPGSITALEEEKRNGATVTVRISADVLFAFGSAELSGSAKTQLKRIAARIGRPRGAVRVVGHTDAIGAESANRKLSKDRADSVKTELSTLLNTATITTDGKGATQPVAPNTSAGKDNPEGRAKNRRVEISYGS